MSLKTYVDIPSFEHIYLEDSYLLNITEIQSKVILKVDTVLTKDHPLYQPPNPESYYCYRLVEIEFPNVREFKWITKSMQPYTDATGEIDYGNIDIFTWSDEGEFHLEGDWGSIEIKSDLPLIRFL